MGGSSQIELRPSRLAVLGKLGFLSLFVSLSACWMYRYAVYAVLDGVEAGTLFLFHYLKKIGFTKLKILWLHIEAGGQKTRTMAVSMERVDCGLVCRKWKGVLDSFYH